MIPFHGKLKEITKVKTRYSSFLVLVILVFPPHQTYPQNILTTRNTLTNEQVQGIIQESEQKIQSILEKEIYLPGLSIALVSRDRTLWTAGF